MENLWQKKQEAPDEQRNADESSASASASTNER